MFIELDIDPDTCQGTRYETASFDAPHIVLILGRKVLPCPRYSGIASHGRFHGS